MSTNSLNIAASVEQERTGSAPVAAIVLGLINLAFATTGLLNGVEPFATWYYQFAWLSVVLVMDGVIAIIGAAGRKGEFLLLDRPRHLFSLMAWSAVVWIFYELLNFRLQNWYYINLPTNTPLRWGSTIVAFATVLPAVFLSFTLMRGLGVAENTRWKPMRVNVRKLRIAGAAMMALVLIWPVYFFPLVWGATTLLVEPWVYQKAPERSLLHDLEHGDPGRLLRLLAGGALIGFLWEMLNIAARAKWIYTVPGLEDIKLFEMPVLGFFGFPPFALECFVLWQALVVAGVALPRANTRFPAGVVRRIAAFALAVALCVGTMWQMDRQTIASLRPSLAGVVGSDQATAFATAGVDAYDLARSDATDVASRFGVATDSASAWVQRAQLVTLRGIGTTYAAMLQRVGVNSIAELAQAEPHELHRRLRDLGDTYITGARVRVWVKGARDRVADGGS